MEEKTVKQLVAFGLSEKEAAVYIAALELGRGTVSQISRKAGINRTTGYDILSSLERVGLVRISGKEPKQEYVAESPDNLLHILERKTESLNKELADIREASQRISGLVPFLRTLHKMEDRPQIKFYEGTDGLKQVYEDTLTSKESIRAFAAIDEMHAALGSYFPSYYRRRAGKGISIRGIVPKTQTSIDRMQYNEEEKRDAVLVPSVEYGFHPEINIYDNKVMIASWREKLGIIIESAEIADAMKKIFELSWIGAKQLEAKP
jgi:HTH-type transcriptional regulator, sugar sensing transcriptional regulator